MVKIAVTKDDRGRLMLYMDSDGYEIECAILTPEQAVWLRDQLQAYIDGAETISAQIEAKTQWDQWD